MRSIRLSTLTKRLLVGGVCVGAIVAVTTTGALASGSSKPSATSVAPAVAAAGPNCETASCTFKLAVNPGLAAGKPFACPAMAAAEATIVVTNRFRTGAVNDVMTLTARHLPPNTGFDLFLVQNSPFDVGFAGFGFGWYQSDVQSDSNGNATVVVRGIFDHETFVLNPPNVVEKTFNVGFWFNSPTQEAERCNGAVPAATPFNGEQNAGLLAMITKDAPLGLIR